jgi:hypothetical protein
MRMILNRNAIIVKPKMSFYEWLQMIEHDDLTPDDVIGQRSIYMVDEVDSTTPEIIAMTVAAYCPEIIIAEIFGWYEDESIIPENLDMILFNKWFDWEFTDSIADLSDEKIEDIKID